MFIALSCMGTRLFFNLIAASVKNNGCYISSSQVFTSVHSAFAVFILFYKLHVVRIFVSLYPPPTKLWRVDWFHHGCLSARWMSMSIRLSVEKWSLHSNSISFWHTMIILHTHIAYDQRNTPIDFGVKRSKFKVKFGLQTFNTFHTITPFPFDLQC